MKISNRDIFQITEVNRTVLKRSCTKETLDIQNCSLDSPDSIHSATSDKVEQVELIAKVWPGGSDTVLQASTAPTLEHYLSPPSFSQTTLLHSYPLSEAFLADVKTLLVMLGALRT